MSSPPRPTNHNHQSNDDIPPSPTSNTNRSAGGAATVTNTARTNHHNSNVNRRSLGQSASTQNLVLLPHNASSRSLGDMNARSNNNNSMESPHSATTANNNAAGIHEVIEFLRAQSVAQEDIDHYKKVFDDQLLRNFSDVKSFGEERLASNGIKRGHARRIFAEIERRDREHQQQLQAQRNRLRGRGLPQSVSTANLYGALYEMTPVATPVAGESHGMFPNISNGNLGNMMNYGTKSTHQQQQQQQFSDPSGPNQNDPDVAVVAVNNSLRAKNDPFRTSAVVVPGDFVCGMCCELLFSARTVPVCGHTFCALCLERWAASQQGNPTCPLCRAPLIPKGSLSNVFELPPVNSLIEGLCQRCFPGRYQRSATSAEEQRRADEEIRLAYALVRHPADGLLVKILLNSINVTRPLELLFLRLPRREFLPPSFLPSAVRIETGSISPTPVEGYGFNMTSASLHATIMSALQLEPGHWFLDAGAGTGVVAAWAATLVGPTGTSLALDHDTKAAQLMRRNRIIHDQLLFHPTMPLSGANFSGEVTTLSNKYCLFPNLASAPIAGRRTQFQNLLLNPSVYETNENSTNTNNNLADRNNNNNNNKSKKLPIAVQILGIERSSAFLDRFAGVAAAKNKATTKEGNNNNNHNEILGLPGISPLSPQSQQQLPFGGGGCVVHATVTIGNSSTSSRRQCRMVGTVRLVEKSDQFQVLSTAQHQQAKQAAKTRITPTTHPRSFSPNEPSNNNNNNNNGVTATSSSDFTSADEIPPVLPNRSQNSGGIRLDFGNNSNNSNNATSSSTASIGNNNNADSSTVGTAGLQRSLSSSLSDESVLCDITDANDMFRTRQDQQDQDQQEQNQNMNNNQNDEDASATSNNNSSPRFHSKFSSKDHYVLFSLREVSVFGSDDTNSVYNFGDAQDVDHERLMRLTFCLTKPIGELLEMVQQENTSSNNSNGKASSAPVVVDAFGIFVASYLRRSDVVATTKFHLLDGGNVLRQLKRWIQGTWVPSEFKPNKYHCLQTNVYDLAQVLFDSNNSNNNSNSLISETKQQILELIRPKEILPTIVQNNNNNVINDDDDDDTLLKENSSSRMMMMGSRSNTAPPNSNNTNNNNNNSTAGFFDRVFLACEPQSEADLKRFQKFLKPGGRMVVPFDGELLLIKRPPASTSSTPIPNNNNSTSTDTNSTQQPPEEFTRESLFQVGFGTFVVPDYHQHNNTSNSVASSSTTEQDGAKNNNNHNNHTANSNHHNHDATSDGDHDGNKNETGENSHNDDDSPPGSPRSGPSEIVAKKITDAIEDEKSHMMYLQESYRLYSLSAMRNRTIKNSPLLPASAGGTSSPLQKISLNSNNNTSSSHQHEENEIVAKNLKNSPFFNTEPKNEPIHLRCCGAKLSNSQWSETIDVEKIWGTAPFPDGKGICIPRPASASEYDLQSNNKNGIDSAASSSSSSSSPPTVAFLKRARGTSYLAYNVDLCARMSYVACSHCETILGAEFCDEPLLTQPFGPWTGRVLMCRAMLCKQSDIVPDDADISGEAVKCSQCDQCIALPSWKLRSEMEMRLRSGGVRNRSLLAGPEYSGLLFSNVRNGSVRFQGSKNNNNNNNSNTSLLKMVSDANLYVGDVHCAKCDQIIGFRVLGCKNPFAKTRFAFSFGRVALIPGRLKGVPYGAGAGVGGVRQPHNLMERIYRAIAQSFGINPAEGTRFILRDGSGNATIFDGSGASGSGNLITWRSLDGASGGDEDEDAEADEHNVSNENNIENNDDAAEDEDEDEEHRQRRNFNNSRAAARRNSMSTSNSRGGSHSSRDDQNHLNDNHHHDENDDLPVLTASSNNNNNNVNSSIAATQGGSNVAIVRRPQAPTPAGELRVSSHRNNEDDGGTENNQSAQPPLIMTSQALRNINASLADQLVADFDFEDTAEGDDEDDDDEDTDVPPIIDDDTHDEHSRRSSDDDDDDDAQHHGSV